MRVQTPSFCFVVGCYNNIDLCDAFMYGMLMEEIHGENEVRLDLMSMADMCDPVEEKQIVESMVSVDDVSGNL